MSDESVKVAVRVRPFNQREKDRMAKLTIDMQGNTTIITNPENSSDKKMFTFDYSYWSHDGFTEDSNGILIPDGLSSRYASQKSVFDDLGKSVLENAFVGYNCSLFAYGQTGSGKSYSMVGYGANKGIVPVICDELFKKMGVNSTDSMRYEVTFSMLEIYNENVRDLLSKEAAPKGGLPVRQTPNQGFYVQGLKKVPVGSYKEIESRMEQGTSNRTVAMTNMNATSSRAHTVVIITFDQILSSNGSDTRKSSIMNLVDLAGSERAESTGATGDRLKEGANINKSLSVLGNVISALADLSNGKKKTVVPYRDSVLTKLLQNALGGNSKTVMIAALSPADINYDETLGTLRYADRAKQIKNKAIVNENPMDKLLRELKAENEKLKQALSSGNLPQTINTQGLNAEEINDLRKEIMEELKAQMMVNSEIIAAEDPEIWNAKLEEARKEVDLISKEEKSDASNRKKYPHLINLNEDPQLSGVIVHYLIDKTALITRIDENEENCSEDEDDTDTNFRKKNKTKNKNQQKKEMTAIVLKGLSISNRHAIIEKKSDNKFTIRPALAGAKTKLNGITLTNESPLSHRDRILFGSHHMYLFINPSNCTENKNLPKIIDWEYAQSEIAHVDGFGTENVQGLTKDQQIVQQQILEILPMISEVNAIAEELEKLKKFEIILVPPNAQDSVFGAAKRTAIMIKVTNTLNENFWFWERGKFMSRRYLMQELYQQFLEDKSLKETVSSKDPFWEPTGEVLLGTANVFLQALAFNLDFDDKIPILNYEGNDEGFITVSVSPSTSNGRVINEDNFVDDPKTLLTRTYHFLITISSVELSNPKYKIGIKVSFRIFKDEKSYETETVKGSNTANFNYNKVISIARITEEHLEYFETGYITFRIYINQDDSNKTILPKFFDNNLSVRRPENRRISVIPTVDSSEEITKLKTDLTIINRKLERLERKDRKLKSLCNDYSLNENNNYESFYRATYAILFSGDNQKFKTDSIIIGNIVNYNSINTNEMKNSNKANGINNGYRKSVSCIRETLVEEDEETDIRKQSRMSQEIQSKACVIM